MGKKRILVLLVSASLILALLFLAWQVDLLDLVLQTAVYHSTLPPPLISLILLLVPLLFGGIVGIWVHPGAQRPWLHASKMAIVLWGLIFLTIFVVTLLMTLINMALAPPDPGHGPMSPAGAIGFLFTWLALLGLIYALSALPFILLGTAITYSRKKK